MRIRIPPFLPAHTVLLLALAYAAGSLWLGLTRLDAIAANADSGAQSAATVQDLESLLIAVADIETAGRGYALTGDESYLAPFERGRRNVPPLLAQLRDRMRGDATELAKIQRLVPLIAERTAISAAGIERKRGTPDKPYEPEFGSRGKESSDEIRTIVMSLVARERDQLMRERAKLGGTIREARRGMFLLSGLTVLVVVLLYFAVRRLRAFIAFEPVAGAGDAIEMTPGASFIAKDAGVGTLLRDTLLRMRVAAAAAAPGSPERAHLRTVMATLETARDQHAVVARDLAQTRREEDDIVQALAMLAASYSSASGLAVKPTLDQRIRVDDPDMAFLIFRTAEWALETIALRKRAGDVTLQMAADDGDLVVRVYALADKPDLPIRLTPKETEQANALQQAVTAQGGVFTVTDSPTGFVLTLRIPRTGGAATQAHAGNA